MPHQRFSRSFFLACGIAIVQLLCIFYYTFASGPANEVTEVTFPEPLNKLCFQEVFSASKLPYPPNYNRPVLEQMSPRIPISTLSPSCAKLFRARHEDKKSLKQTKLQSSFTQNLRPAVRRLRLLLKRLRDTFSAANIDLIMSSNTIAVSLSHHGVVPFETELDFRIANEAKVRARKLLKVICEDDKICHLGNTDAENYYWKINYCGNHAFCQINIRFYRRLSQSLIVSEHPYNFLPSTFFPLVERPFEGLLFQSPRYPMRVLRNTYDTSSIIKCFAIKHSGIKLTRRQHPQIDCALLEPFAPYVRKMIDPSLGTLEVRLNDSFLESLFFVPNVES